jgi:nucleotide-binding universal stress UspA family protein
VIDYPGHPTPNVYDSIIVPTDGSEAAETAAEHGIAQAGAHDAGLVFLAVVEMSGGAAPETRGGDAVDSQRQDRRDHVESLVAQAEQAGVDAEGVVETGVPSQVILEQTSARGADMVVMATEARSGVGRFLFGSVTEQVIRDGDTPVLAIQR